MLIRRAEADSDVPFSLISIYKYKYICIYKYITNIFSIFSKKAGNEADFLV